jgi:pyruvate dehydrogenase E2 component (dihydrolipoamide acetyltransferase)
MKDECSAFFFILHHSSFILPYIIPMLQHTLSLPDLGIDDQPVTLSVWLAKRGAKVKEGDPLVEVLCGGVTVDLPSPSDGFLTEKLVAEDETLSTGQRLAIIEEAI